MENTNTPNPSEDVAALKRQLRPPDGQFHIFDVEPDWRSDWWGMPSFEMGNAEPQYKIQLNFMTAEDVADFAKATGIPVTTKTDSAWFPPQKYMGCGEYIYDGPPTDSKYPVCIPSKGRARIQKTGKVLDRMGVSYKFFVEETEYEEYCLCLGRRIIIRGGGLFRAMEDYVDRYENVAMAGPHDKAFINDRNPRLSPFLFNSRIYSCVLLDTTLPHRWRGKFNEDTDLSLRLLKDGRPTLLFRAFVFGKPGTAFAENRSAMPGGNTDHVYNTNDHRRAFAESLREQHPDVVKVVWKFNRWHHEVDYKPFKRNRPILKADVVPTKSTNEYGMRLVRAKEPKGPRAAEACEAAPLEASA